MEFIFMLTHHDVTIPNALQVFDEVKDTGLKCIGCKDIGLNIDQYSIWQKQSEINNRFSPVSLVVFTNETDSIFRGRLRKEGAVAYRRVNEATSKPMKTLIKITYNYTTTCARCFRENERSRQRRT